MVKCAVAVRDLLEQAVGGLLEIPGHSADVDLIALGVMGVDALLPDLHQVPLFAVRVYQ